MSNYKMKSLLKGLRYISQIFENEKEPEMQIGNPTDVKHVAHIGWDGGAVDSPTWMNGFKNHPGGFSSAPLGDIKEDASWVSEESTRSRDMPGIPRSSRSHRPSNLGSPTKSERSSRRRSSNPDGHSKSSRKSKDSSDILPDGSRKSRRKKSKDSANGGGGSSRSSRRARDSTDSMSVPNYDE
ncbi:PREDICTED: CRIB domain-containing protein RIC8 [Tarenaya hassleriana]|uniref:CRIB domain-containing protein RIC8 n=1 Tax=Tarenaya hassleriana TaxID=28532 RepID=UPI00053C80D8|nr:PREDICTED: CRIB domain-containing protein RIC8 [Tarenaya hassleriana]